MKPFSFHKMKNLVGTFKRFSSDNFMTKLKFQMVFRTTLTSEYMNFICDQFKGEFMNWKEVCLGIALHPFYLLPESFELEKQSSDFKTAESLTVGDFPENHLPKEGFVEHCELFVEGHKDISHPKMTHKQIRETVWMILEENDLIFHDNLVFYLCDDFHSLKTLFNFFSLNDGATPDQISRFLQFKKKEKDITTVSKKISEHFPSTPLISFREFIDSSVGKELAESYLPFLTKKQIDDESDEKFQFVRRLEDENMIQLKSPPLFEKLFSSGYSSPYCIHVLSELLLKNPQTPAFELQKVLTNEHIITNPSRIENEIVGSVVMNIAKNDRNSHSMNMLIDLIRRLNPTLQNDIINDKKLLQLAIPLKIQKLDSELNDRERPLSSNGYEKVKRFRDFFSDLLKKLNEEDVDNNEEEVEGEDVDVEENKSGGEEGMKISFTYDQAVEIQKEVLKCYIQNRATLDDIKGYIREEPLLEGLELMEFLTHEHSGMKVSPQVAKNLIGYVTFNFKRTQLLTIYDPVLMCDHQKELILNIGHFLSLVEEPQVELDVLLGRAVMDVGLGIRPFIILNGLRSVPDSDKWVAMFIRKDGEGELQLLAADSMNGRGPLGKVICSSEENDDDEKKNLHTRYIWRKFIKPTNRSIDEIKRVFLEGKDEFKKTRFLDEVSEVMKNVDCHLPKLMDLLLTKGSLDEDNEFRMWIYKFMDFWKLYCKKGTIKSMKTLLKENFEMKKELKEMRLEMNKLREENEFLKRKE